MKGRLHNDELHNLVKKQLLSTTDSKNMSRQLVRVSLQSIPYVMIM